jgi:tetratricopeptide (TPR) repeat protein
MGLAAIARLVLTGRIALAAGDAPAAEAAFRKAVDIQAKFDANGDPPLWWYPVRRSVAAALLAEGRNEDAAREATASLAAAPRDALALKVRAEAERRLGHGADAERDLAQARKAWKGDLAAVDLRGA